MSDVVFESVGGQLNSNNRLVPKITIRYYLTSLHAYFLDYSLAQVITIIINNQLIMTYLRTDFLTYSPTTQVTIQVKSSVSDFLQMENF